ncbi:uncharacterized protein LOC114719987 [Neltuma alba]|uniref:uncharacterized protein LOC114719987 n=1 Tax=Neltuma alba TaxID=207710 RepID=UPI0010A55273|nr:uncharacterized protein LOC114719987 [Prosopis alba]
MAGLQQYNFFPTDLLYPRRPPSVAPAVIPLQPPQQETSSDLHLQNQPTSFVNVPPSASSALVSSHKAQSPFHADKKRSKLSTDPLSFLFRAAEEEASDAS